MPEGHDLKKILARVIRRSGVTVENRVMATRVLMDEGAAAGALGFNVRTGEFLAIRAKAVVLACGAAGRLGLPASGYLMGTYENPSNAGDGYSMAYHAGAELTNIECFQINPLLKDYNGPSVRICQWTVWRPHSERAGRPLSALRLLEWPDDA